MKRKLAGVFVALIVLVGCDQAAAPQTPAEVLAALEISVQESVKEIGVLAKANVIVGDQAALALDAIGSVEKALIVARLAVRYYEETGSNPQPALDALNQALIALLAIAEKHQGEEQ